MSLSERLEEAKDRLKDIKIMVLGDSVIDRYALVEPEGISREAPIPAVSIKREYYTLGASFNAVKSLLELSASPIYVTAVGSDSEGELFAKRVKGEVKDSEVISDSKRSTDSVFRVYSNGYLMLWAEKSSKKPLSKEAESKIIKKLKERSSEAKAIIVSDHARGFLTKDIREAVVQAAKSNSVPVIINGRPENIYLYEGADYLRMNREDAVKLTGIAPINSTSYRNMALKLSSISKVENVMITWLEDGFYALKGESFFSVKPVSFKPSRLTGIGDVIVASFSVFLSLGFSYEDSVRLSYYASLLKAQGEGSKGRFIDRLIDFLKQVS